MRTATSPKLFVLVLAFALAGCGMKTMPWWNVDGGAADADSDADSDTDVDADVDSDSDTDPGSYADDDGDYLSDAFEEELGTDPEDPDSDGDGCPDFVEWFAGTDPLDPDSNPAAEGHSYFLIPYEEATVPDEDTFVFATEIRLADVFFAMDTTGSMNGEISNLKGTLTSTIVPGLQAAIDSVWFGVGFFDDYPVSPYGTAATDSVFGLLQAMTPNVATAQDGVDALALHGGNDWAEGQVPALWAIATGEGLGGFLDPQTGCPPGRYGYPCFRPGAMPIVILMTDAPFHNGPGGYDPYGSDVSPTAPTYLEAVEALGELHARVITVYSGPVEVDGQTHCEALSLDTGAAVDGEPLMFPIASTGAGLDEAIVGAVDELVTAVPLDISTFARDYESDTVDAAALIVRVVPNTEGGLADPQDPTVICVGGLDTENNDGDPEDDVFTDVFPGTPVCFDIVPIAQNETIPEQLEPQLYPAFVDVYGAETVLLDTREVFFIVPPTVPVN
ncbi:MAG: thrombospondin type 3 repeat-containing protein [Proteobacteria bacterium]|nr:thrombospondin type 3 repeat-containing protein [Pseudomonadota bacterium]